MKRYILCLILVLISINTSFSLPSDSISKPNGVVFSYVGNLPKQIVGLNFFFLRGIYLTLKCTPTTFKFYEKVSSYEAEYIWGDRLIEEKDGWETIGLGLLRQLNNETFVYFGPGLVFRSKYRIYYDEYHILSEDSQYGTRIKKATSINVNAGFLFCLTGEGPQGVYLIVGGNSNPRGVDIGLGLKFR